ncbi:pyridoxamine 5'-phosphate oxidase [Mongoliitalea daihaiensis]|uniref:pyridoxamine 5'-phosphate oxidase n=1 Tax=Mongoliitalea daihaiensis TaxID=2782006 RepID=UPI001F416B8B|nr:pyridoxamine 5'-phosphate oxidase [Mongoliitalea daihaiensis]UJP64089.1 pyridoxamine 5'-phosphate oxidase [Mongoliitalea daihaiensis]
MKLADIRIDYSLKSLDSTDVAENPIQQFNQWFEEAIQAKVMEANAMNLSTLGKDGFPNSRIVLLKGVDHGFVFYTNYQSAKGQELIHDPKVALTFFWPELERQVRVVGKAAKVSPEESDEYFFSRPFSSQIGAWVSPQSQEIPDRKYLADREQMYSKELSPETIKRPPHWGGFRITPIEIEFWQGRPSRLHDRILYTLQGTEKWSIKRIAP